MRNKTLISLIPGLLISIPALWLAFRNVPLADLLSYMGDIHWFWVLPSVFIVFVSFSLRSLRWQMIVASVHPLSFWAAFHPLMIGFMLNCILPGRVGELARPLILNRNTGIPLSSGLATVAAERIFDLLLLLAFLLIVMAHVEIAPDTEIHFKNMHLNRETLSMIESGMLKLTVVLIAGIICVTADKSRKFIQRCIMRAPSLLFFLSASAKQKLTEKICVPISCLAESFASGFMLLRSWKKMGICIVLSALIWILSAFSYYVFSLGCPGIDLSFAEMFAVMILICFFIALPSVPGFWGVWEAGGVFALSLFGIAGPDAAGFTLANHAIQVFPVIVIGLISAMIAGVRIFRISDAGAP
ncbi:MAG: lysylphosphatidylglycerol synthase transmembrane domain-containing protein [Desulfobacterales bacterium]